jgi:peptidoglycan/xylan/chitin deacetylase (PgdA/CDA1 family)
MRSHHRRFVLNLHGLGPVERQLDDGEIDVWLSREQFVAVLDAIDGRDDIDITFDDGNVTDHAIALPELRARGRRATFFVVAGRIGRSGFLSQEQLAELRGAGMTIGNHGMRHVPWRHRTAAELDEELVVAREALQSAAGREITTASCPFGAYDRKVVAAARRAGYSELYTSDRGPAAGGFLRSRVTLHRNDPVRELGEALNEPVQALAARELRKVVKRWR